MGKKGDLSDFERGMVGARRADLSISKTADLLWFSHTTLSRVYREWSEKEKISSERQLCGRKCLVDVRNQRRMGRLVRDDRKTTVTQINTRYNQGMQNNNNNNNFLHLYSAFLDTQSALHSKGAISSSTTNVQHPPGWCAGSHIAPERPPHTSLLVERKQSDEANQCMGMIRRPWWSEVSGLVWPGCRGNTPTLFRRTSWNF